MSPHGKGDAVGGNEDVRVPEVGGGRRHQVELHRPLPQFGLARCRLPLLWFLLFQ